MKELNECSVHISSEGVEQEEVLDERNVYTSFLLPSPVEYGYWGGEALEYPWINGYKYEATGTEETYEIFDLKKDRLANLAGRKIRA